MEERRATKSCPNDNDASESIGGRFKWYREDKPNATDGWIEAMVAISASQGTLLNRPMDEEMVQRARRDGRLLRKQAAVHQNEMVRATAMAKQEKEEVEKQKRVTKRRRIAAKEAEQQKREANVERWMEISQVTLERTCQELKDQLLLRNMPISKNGDAR